MRHFEKLAWHKALLFLFTLFSLTFTGLALTQFLSKNAQAADKNAVPEPVVPCLEDEALGTRNPEFHSLRPYQASPCGDPPKTYFCNNDYTIVEPVSMRWDPDRCGIISVGPPGSDPLDNANFTCIPPPNAVVNGEDVFVIGGPDGKDYSIGLSDVKFPIMGNTENVFNSQQPQEDFDDAEKMNEYVNWYLQGRIEKAEYGINEPSRPGPINAAGFCTTFAASLCSAIGIIPPFGTLCPSATIASLCNAAISRNVDPVVLCTNVLGALGGPDTVRRCVDILSASIAQSETFAGPAKKLVPQDYIHFRKLGVLHHAGTHPHPPLAVDPDEFDPDWYEEYPDLIKFDPAINAWVIDMALAHNQIAVCTDTNGIAKRCYAGNGTRATGTLWRLVDWWEARGSTPKETFLDWNGTQYWGGVTPPFPWQFSEYIYYMKAYSEWRGRICLIAAGTLFCTPFTPSFQADDAANYKYIPLGNASDKNVKHQVNGMRVEGPGVTEVYLHDYTIAKEPVLHYPHTQATVESADLLNSIHTPLECIEQEAGTTTTPLIPGEGDSCCQTGFNYQPGFCMNNTASGLCTGFATALCSQLPLLGSLICSQFVPQISNACERGIVANVDSGTAATLATTICQGLFSGVLSPWGILGGLNICRNVVFDVIAPAFEAGNLAQPPECSPGLTCDTGRCINPIATNKTGLECKKIKGLGLDYEPTTCEFVDIRSNPGDSLTFETASGANDNVNTKLIADSVMTVVERIECQGGQLARFFEPVDPTNPSGGGCGGEPTRDPCQYSGCVLSLCGGTCGDLPGLCRNWPICRADISVIIPTSPRIPYADQIWKSTVVGRTSAFRKIFPKIEPGAPVECIEEIVGESNVNYHPSPETPLRRVTTAGPNVYGLSGKLFFPHLGTIYEYFLKGIQTALRPQGMGSPIPRGTDSPECIRETVVCSEELAKLPVPECQLDAILAIETNTIASTGTIGNPGTGGCVTPSGRSFGCCTGIGCGPAQITCSQYDQWDGGDNLDMCGICDSKLLLARAMLFKLCQADGNLSGDGRCNSGGWKEWGDYILKHYSIEDGDYTAACYYTGARNGCHPTGCVQYRWGEGWTYGQAVGVLCNGGTVESLPVGPFPEFCEACSREIVNSGQPPLQCTP